MATHYDVAPGLVTRTVSARTGYWFQTESIANAVFTISKLNLDTVEGRRDALAVLNDVRSVRGRELFTLENPGRRFPNTYDDFYVSTSHHEAFYRSWVSLGRALADRDTAVAKDMQTGRAGSSAGSTIEGTSQSAQDRKKGILELLLTINAQISDATNIWGQSRFERELGLSWV